MCKATTSILRTILLASVLPLASHAQGITFAPTNTGSNGTGNTAQSAAHSSARSAAVSASRSSLRSAITSNPTNTVTSGAAGGTGSASTGPISISSTTGSGSYRLPYEAPSIAPPAIYNSSTCSGGGVTGGVSFPVGSTSLGISNMDRTCQALRVHGDPVAAETLCIESDDYRLARKHMAMMRRAEPCFADIREVMEYLSRSETIARVQTAEMVQPSAPALPAYCSAYGAGSVAPKECE